MDLNLVQNSLKSCTLFQSLDKGWLGLLAMTATERPVDSGDIVYQQGIPPESLVSLFPGKWTYSPGKVWH